MCGGKGGEGHSCDASDGKISCISFLPLFFALTPCGPAVSLSLSRRCSRVCERKMPFKGRLFYIMLASDPSPDQRVKQRLQRRTHALPDRGSAGSGK